MLSIGWSELLIVAAIALIVVGPRDLPVMLRHLGRAAGAVRRMGNEFRAEIDKVGAADDLKQLRRSFADPLKAATRDINRQFNKPETAAQPAPREYAEAAAAKAAAADAQSTPSIAADGAPEPKSADDARPAAAQAATGKPKPKRTRKPAKRAAAKPRTAKSASAKSTSAKSTSAKSTSAKSTSAKTSPSRRAASRKPAG